MGGLLIFAWAQQSATAVSLQKKQPQYQKKMRKDICLFDVGSTGREACAETLVLLLFNSSALRVHRVSALILTKNTSQSEFRQRVSSNYTRNEDLGERGGLQRRAIAQLSR